MSEKNIGAVITAYGAKRALNKVQGMTLAEYIVVNFQRAGVKDIVMITGEEDETLKKQLKGFGVTFLRNSGAENVEMLDSVKLGLTYLMQRCERVFICPVDVPFFSADTIQKLLMPHAEVVIPSYHHSGGHPVLLKDSVFENILNYDGEDGLRGAIRSLNKEPDYVEISDPGTIETVDGDFDAKEIVNTYHRHLNRAQVKLRLMYTKPYFGPGTVTLLRQIDRLGAVREACEKTGISYSKAWSMIRTAEEQTGLLLVNRQQGGKLGGMAYVTEDGHELIRKYEELEQSIERFAEQEFNRIFEADDTQK